MVVFSSSSFGFEGLAGSARWETFADPVFFVKIAWCFDVRE